MSKNKKNNKREFYKNYGEFILIILVFIGAFGLGYYQVHNKPQFNITITECHNETQNSPSFLILESKNETQLLFANYGTKIYEGYVAEKIANMMGYIYNSTCIKDVKDDYGNSLPYSYICYSTKEVCETKEVEEIEYHLCVQAEVIDGEQYQIAYYIKSNETPKGNNPKNLTFNKIQVLNNQPCFFSFHSETILKKDLTIDWLDENCKPKRCTSCEDLLCKNQKCNLYTCGDYQVEVLK